MLPKEITGNFHRLKDTSIMVGIEKVLSTISFNREEIRPSKEVLVQNAHVTSRILGYSPSCLNVKEALEMLIKSGKTAATLKS